MRYFIMSKTGLGLFLVPRLNSEKEVERIYFYCPDPTLELGKGLENLPEYSKFQLLKEIGHPLNHVTGHTDIADGKEHTTDPKSELTIVIDDVGFGETGNFLRSQGFKVIGGSVFTDRIENDRMFATRLMSKIMKVPESTAFNSFDEGLKFLEDQKKDARFVFKPHDAMVPKQYTYVAKDISDLTEAMKSFQADWKWEETFQLQEFIVGKEMDFSAYFNGKQYLKNSMIYYFENKPLCSGDIGPATGGSIAVEFARPLRGKFFEILEKLKPYLEKNNYQGQISINCIVSEIDHEPYFLEFCGRFGYPSLPADITLLEDNKKSVHALFQAIVNGQDLDCFTTKEVATVLSVYSPPFPSKEAREIKGEPISWDKKYDPYFFPYFIMADKKEMVLSGDSGEVLNVTCVASTLDKAVSMLYDTYMPTLRLKDAYWRNDLGKDARDRIETLRKWGVI